MPSFNLLDMGWIPCLRTSSDPPELLSVRQVFQQANALRQIADPAPTVTAALHRLLLAILHRSLNGPQTPEEWGSIWRAGAWDVARIEAYLGRVHDRFDLFDAAHPFYQTTNLDKGSFKEINQLTHDRASDRTKALLFDHSLPGNGLPPDAVARYLLAQQTFSVGGLFSLNQTDPPSAKYGPASPLLKSAVCLAMGNTLFETLMLTWHQYNRMAEAPFPFAGDDKPAWERDEPVTPTERRPDGWVDLLTWQCRRIALQAETLPDGGVVVTHAALMQGYRLPQTFDLHQAETMVAYSMLKNPTRSDDSPWIPVGLNVTKSVWRDSHALFQSFDAEHPRPRILDWLQRLIAEGQLYAEQKPKIIPLNIYGIIPDKAKIDDWRSETLALPQLFLERPEVASKLADIVRRELELAENISHLLQPRLLNLPHPQKQFTVKGPSPLRVLAEELLRSTSERNADPKAIAALGRHLSPVETYWSALESPFRAFLVALADDVYQDQFGDITEWGDATRTWAAEIKRVARRCFDQMAGGLENSGKALRASTKAYQQFDRFLYCLDAAHQALLPSLKGGTTDARSQAR